MELFEPAQDYLERILMLEEERGENKVRAIDVANSLGFSRASVSIAMHRLEESGYLTFGDNKELIMTEAGRKEAIRIYERHQVLSALLINIGVDEETATEDACRIEHVISDTTFNAVKKAINK
jgi:Mn-dependent DtxR family transcriptional regulator